MKPVSFSELTSNCGVGSRSSRGLANRRAVRKIERPGKSTQIVECRILVSNFTNGMALRYS